MKNFLFLDSETSGTEKQHGIIQIAGFIDRVNHLNDIEPLENFNFLCNIFKDEVFSKEALEVNGHKESEIANYPLPSETYQKLHTILQKYVHYPDKYTMVAYNSSFDYEMLNKWYPKASNGKKQFWHFICGNVFDLMSIMVDLNSWGKIKTKNLKLKTVADYFGIQYQAHDAFDDVGATRELYYRYKRYQENNLPIESMSTPFEFKKEVLENIELE